MSTMTSMPESELRETLCVLLRLFYAKDWVSGTGGGICGVLSNGALLVAPTGVHKEMVQPDDLFVLDAETCEIKSAAPGPNLKPSECSPIFAAIVRARGAGSVVHSHALASVLAADLAERVSTDEAGTPRANLRIDHLEMLKGIRSVANSDTHLVPVIDNTAREADLASAVERACSDPRYASAAAILVKDHGAYIWGADVWEAKRHAEVYHFLFQAVHARSPRA